MVYFSKTSIPYFEFTLAMAHEKVFNASSICSFETINGGIQRIKESRSQGYAAKNEDPGNP
jgi:hypothetical protein